MGFLTYALSIDGMRASPPIPPSPVLPRLSWFGEPPLSVHTHMALRIHKGKAGMPSIEEAQVPECVLLSTKKPTNYLSIDLIESELAVQLIWSTPG